MFPQPIAPLPHDPSVSGQAPFNFTPEFFSLEEKASFYWQDPKILLLLVGGLAVLILYYVLAAVIGRHRPGKSALRIDQPPHQFSPVALRYIYKRGYDTKCLIVSVLNATMKGCYQIRWGAKGFLAQQRPDAPFDTLNRTDQIALAIHGENYWDNIAITRRYNSKTRRMGDQLEKYLRRSFRKLFKKRLLLKIGGFVLSLGICIALFSQAPGKETMPWLAGYLLMLSFFIVVPLIFLFQVLRDRYWYGIFYSLVFLVMGCVGISYLELKAGTPLYSIGVLPFLAINFIATPRLNGLSRKGGILVGQVNAYRNYLQQKMKVVMDQYGTLRPMQDEIPYLLALDLDTGFSPYFQKMLSQVRYEPYQIFDQIHR